jgi:electron transfer flavoprotein alpha/beta subunit
VKVLVSVKRVVNVLNVKISMKPFDKMAVEEAVRLKEKGTAICRHQQGPGSADLLRGRLRARGGPVRGGAGACEGARLSAQEFCLSIKRTS